MCDDVWKYILEIYHAVKIQENWRRFAYKRKQKAVIHIQKSWLLYFYRCHEKHPNWLQLYEHMCNLGVLDLTLKYWSIRREFRSEPESWLYRYNSEDIIIECFSNEWGFPRERAYTKKLLGQYVF